MTQARKRRRPRLARIESRKVPRQDRARDTVEKLLDTTEVLLEEIGLDRLTTILIAERAQFSVGTVYEYFPNKHAVLFALVSRWIDMMEEVIVNNDVEKRGYLGWSQWYDNFMTDLIGVYDRERGLVRYYDMLVSVPELRELDAKVDKLVADYLKRSLSFFFPLSDEDAVNILVRMMITSIHNVLRFAVNMPRASREKMLSNLHFMLQALLLKTVR